MVVMGLEDMPRTIDVGPARIGPEAGRLTLIAGPCIVESLDLCREVATTVKALCAEIGFDYIFKASFDKANRTSGGSFRGKGMDAGLEALATIREEFGLPVTTDVHEPWQAEKVAEVADLLQIPAFLCRQTDLLVACAETGTAVNVKKGQFLAPWDMANVVKKLAETGNTNVLQTERGVSFGYNTLVVDMTSLPQMRALGYPVCLDATHSTQMPGAAGTSTGGRREMIPYLARAAAAVGVDALFMEVHPEPEKGLSDAATMFRLSELPALLRQVKEIDAMIRRAWVTPHAADITPHAAA
jgi:2-dehydro-3-deoxyphosphooctonate aldolase (KDO 8-P synthase)